ncbi:MAG: phosphate ABC transporter substrate-binding protein PstS [Chloroflexi bacterium]|nr:phosphate ABC transporter substrate-binding protein PstS [Chloroflexota bacterium]
MTRTTIVRTLTMMLVAVSLLTVVSSPVHAQSWAPRQVQASLKGSGATFPAPLYASWIETYKQVVPGVSISYQPVGSGQGIRDFIAYLTDFGGTDAAISASRVQTEAPDALHIPMVIGAVVPTYNLPGITNLRFNPEILAGIYLGAIRNWNDPRIAKANPDVKLPNQRITVVYRSDSSGTTSIWTDYLSKISSDWRSKVGSGTTVRWPVGVGAPGNPGVAGTVKNTRGAIGYVEQVFATANRLPLPAVQNASGNYVAASIEATSAAADGVPIPANLVASITNSPNPNAYPIAGFTYILVRQNTYKDVPKAQALTDFLYWSLTEGTGAATRLGYAPLPTSLRVRAIQSLQSVTIDGQRVFDGPAR